VGLSQQEREHLLALLADAPTVGVAIARVVGEFAAARSRLFGRESP